MPRYSFRRIRSRQVRPADHGVPSGGPRPSPWLLCYVDDGRDTMFPSEIDKYRHIGPVNKCGSHGIPAAGINYGRVRSLVQAARLCDHEYSRVKPRSTTVRQDGGDINGAECTSEKKLSLVDFLYRFDVMIGNEGINQHRPCSLSDT